MRFHKKPRFLEPPSAPVVGFISTWCEAGVFASGSDPRFMFSLAEAILATLG